MQVKGEKEARYNRVKHRYDFTAEQHENHRLIICSCLLTSSEVNVAAAAIAGAKPNRSPWTLQMSSRVPKTGSERIQEGRNENGGGTFSEAGKKK